MFFVFIITNLLLRLLYSLKEKILTNEEKFNHYLVRGFMEMVVFRINRKFDAEITRVTPPRQDPDYNGSSHCFAQGT